MYTTMYILGAIAAILTVVFRYKQYSAPPVRATIMETVVVIIAVLSGKILYGLEELLYGNSFAIDGIRIFGLIYSVPVTCMILFKFSKLKWIDALSLCTPGLAMSSVFARIGCHFAGCCGGPPFIWRGVLVDIPEQLIEGGADLLIFCVLLLIERKGDKYRKLLYPIYLFFYSILRFTLDFLRDSPKVLLELTLAQWICITSVVIVIVWFSFVITQNKTCAKEQKISERRGGK